MVYTAEIHADKKQNFAVIIRFPTQQCSVLQIAHLTIWNPPHNCLQAKDEKPWKPLNIYAFENHPIYTSNTI